MNDIIALLEQILDRLARIQAQLETNYTYDWKEEDGEG